MTQNNILKVTSLFTFLILGTTSVFASLELDDVYFDPAIIAAGDEVDII
jgi:hypothetical protein